LLSSQFVVEGRSLRSTSSGPRASRGADRPRLVGRSALQYRPDLPGSKPSRSQLRSIGPKGS